ncbi:MAG: hypothetical protein Q4P17_07485 [Methanobacterium sp.]|nr:hypothetical protein [Methanobacterium sp.]
MPLFLAFPVLGGLLLGEGCSVGYGYPVLLISLNRGLVIFTT